MYTFWDTWAWKAICIIAFLLAVCLYHTYPAKAQEKPSVECDQPIKPNTKLELQIRLANLHLNTAATLATWEQLEAFWPEYCRRESRWITVDGRNPSSLVTDFEVYITRTYPRIFGRYCELPHICVSSFKGLKLQQWREDEQRERTIEDLKRLNKK